MNKYIRVGGTLTGQPLDPVDPKDATIQQLREALTQAEQERDKAHARAIVAEQHKVLSLLGKTEWQQVVEEQLRVKLAETEVRAEQAEASLVAMTQDLAEMAKARDHYKAGQDRWYERAMSAAIQKAQG